MADSEKPFLPFPARVQAAGQKGLFPRKRLLHAGLCLLLISFFLHFFIDKLLPFLLNFFTFEHLAQDPVEAVKDLVLLILALSGVVFFALGVCVFLSFLLYSDSVSKKGATLISLPDKIPTMLDEIITGLLGSFCLIFIFIGLLWESDFTYEAFFTEPVFVFSKILKLIQSMTAATGVVFCIVGLIQYFMYQQRLYNALSLDRSEAEKESILNEGMGKRFFYRGKSRTTLK